MCPVTLGELVKHDRRETIDLEALVRTTLEQIIQAREKVEEAERVKAVTEVLSRSAYIQQKLVERVFDFLEHQLEAADNAADVAYQRAAESLRTTRGILESTRRRREREARAAAQTAWLDRKDHAVQVMMDMGLPLLQLSQLTLQLACKSALALGSGNTRVSRPALPVRETERSSR